MDPWYWWSSKCSTHLWWIWRGCSKGCARCSTEARFEFCHRILTARALQVGAAALQKFNFNLLLENIKVISPNQLIYFLVFSYSVNWRSKYQKYIHCTGSTIQVILGGYGREYKVQVWNPKSSINKVQVTVTRSTQERGCVFSPEGCMYYVHTTYTLLLWPLLSCTLWI